MEMLILGLQGTILLNKIFQRFIKWQENWFQEGFKTSLLSLKYDFLLDVCDDTSAMMLKINCEKKEFVNWMALELERIVLSIKYDNLLRVNGVNCNMQLKEPKKSHIFIVVCWSLSQDHAWFWGGWFSLSEF